MAEMQNKDCLKSSRTFEETQSLVRRDFSNLLAPSSHEREKEKVDTTFEANAGYRNARYDRTPFIREVYGGRYLADSHTKLRNFSFFDAIFEFK